MSQPSKKKAAHAPRRGRPTADRVQAIDSSIRAAALEIFLDLGFEAASMDAIAARAPVSKGTLYARFDSKQQLFRAVMVEELERMSDEAGAQDHLLPANLTPRLLCHAQTLFETFRQPRFRAFGSLIDSAVLTFPELEADWQELGTGRYLRFLAEDIAKTSEGKDLSCEDREFLANLFLHSITGHHRSAVQMRKTSDNGSLEFAARIADVIALFIGGSRLRSS